MLRQAFIILLVTFLLAEIAFRIFNYLRPSFIFHDSSYNRFRGKPNEENFDFRLNSKGFKDVEFNAKKEDGAYRVLGLGDSFAFGVVPYQYNYLTLLEANLNDEGRRVEVINMGIPGIGAKDYLALLENEGLQLKPDMVLLSFFIGNDFLREADERKLYSYSYVASFVNYLITVNRERLVQPNVAYDDNEPTFNDTKYVSLENDRSEIYRKQNQSFKSDFAEAMSYLTKIKQRCDENNISFAVVLIPDEVQVNKTLQSRVLQIKAFNSGPDDFDFALPNKMVAAKLTEQKIKFVDLLDNFAAANGANLYKPNDTHWNIAGNKLAAEIIQANLFDNEQAANQSPEPNSLEGFHDATDCNSIKGWVWDTLRPNDPVKVEIYEGQTLIATVSANLFRKDLLDARKGNGAHAFDYPTPARLKDGRPHVIRAKAAGTGFNLTGTSKQIDCKPE